MRSGAVVTVVLAGIAGVSALTAWLVTMGTRGGELADVLSTSLSALSLMVTVASLVITVRNPPRPRPARTRPKWRWVAAGVLAALLLGVSGYAWFVVKPDIPVTDRATVVGGEHMGAGVEAVIQIPGAPPARRHFVFVPALDNPAKVGDCVGSARLRIALMVDGKKTFQDTGRLPGQEITLDLDGVTREARVLVLIDMKDPSCEVRLSLADAVLYN